jgi:GT2 family glycosyltransferase
VQPFVRVVVLNYNGGEYVLECLESLRAVDWPSDRMEVVVVDNASSDGSPDAVAGRFPDVALIRNPRNDGFSANNLALADLHDVTYVALVNPDAVVEPGWLRALVAAAERDATIGAVSPKMLLHDRVLEIPVETSGPIDVRGVWVDGADRSGECLRVWRLLGRDVSADRVRLGAGRTRLAIPVETSAARVELLVSAPGPTHVAAGEWSGVVQGPPVRARTEARGAARDIINNAGIEPRAHAYFADRGLGAYDGPPFDRPEEVFGWTGGGVLLRSAYLEDVGLFDDLFFLYYEDVDLSWRGRSRGWRFVYEPRAVMRHHHAASTVEGSALFVFENERNHLLTLFKNAPLGYAGRCALRFLWSTLGYVRADVLHPLAQREPIRTHIVRTRFRVVASLVRSLPAIRRSRRQVQRRRTARHEDVLAWLP